MNNSIDHNFFNIKTSEKNKTIDIQPTTVRLEKCLKSLATLCQGLNAKEENLNGYQILQALKKEIDKAVSATATSKHESEVDVDESKQSTSNRGRYSGAM